MQIIIMRHGDAEPMQVNDSERNLTSLGEKQAQHTGRWLNKYYHANKGIEFALVSPYQRAQQSYNQLASQVNVVRKELCDDIVPEGCSRLVHDYIDYLIAQHHVERNLLLVSHMPFVSYLFDELCGVNKSLLFATSSCAIIDYVPEKLSGQPIEFYYPNRE
ncbi:MAG: phosphohistidine phosphatase [Paraglaciecola sp.]|jgi:phosphohistidine phosphatase